MRGASGDSPAFRKVLCDARRAGAAGDADRARQLLRLARRLAPMGDARNLHFVGESRGAWAGGEPPRRESGGEYVQLPELTFLRVTDGLNEVRALDLPAAPAAVRSATAARVAVVVPRRRVARWRSTAAVTAVLLIALQFLPGGVSWRSILGRVGLAVGFPEHSVRVLASIDDSGGLLLRASAKEAAGDSAGAAEDLVAAAAAARPPGEDAWEAGVRLSRMEGREVEAADAFLRAYAAGADRSRWGRIADALDIAGRGVEASRVRHGVGR